MVSAAAAPGASCGTYASMRMHNRPVQPSASDRQAATMAIVRAGGRRAASLACGRTKSAIFVLVARAAAAAPVRQHAPGALARLTAPGRATPCCPRLRPRPRPHPPSQPPCSRRRRRPLEAGPHDGRRSDCAPGAAVRGPVGGASRAAGVAAAAASRRAGQAQEESSPLHHPRGPVHPGKPSPAPPRPAPPIDPPTGRDAGHPVASGPSHPAPVARSHGCACAEAARKLPRPPWARHDMCRPARLGAATPTHAPARPPPAPRSQRCSPHRSEPPRCCPDPVSTFRSAR